MVEQRRAWRRRVSAAAALGTLAAVSMSAVRTPAMADHGGPHCPNAFVSVKEERVRSVDAEIAYSLFLPHEGTGRPVPAIINTHGYGEGKRLEAFDNHGNHGQRRLCTLLSWGYAVLTFDQRGFNDSSGTSQWTHPAFEGRDFMALVDLLASNKKVHSDRSGNKAPLNQLVRQDRPGDPRVGAYAGSFGGAAVAIGASVDPRLDALVLFNTWGDAREALAPQNVPKRTWLAAATYSSPNNPNVPGVDAATQLPRRDTDGGEPELLGRMLEQAVVEGEFTDGTLEDLWRRSPLRYALRPERLTPTEGEPSFEPIKVRGIQAPTLLVQSPNDVVFPTNQLLALHGALRARDVPARELWYCSAGEHAGAHNSATFQLAQPCRSATAAEREREKQDGRRAGDTQLVRIDDASRQWLDRHLSGDRKVATGARFEIQLQDGTWQTFDELPTPAVPADWSGSVHHLAAPVSGYAVGPAPAGCTPPPPSAASTEIGAALWCPALPDGATKVEGLEVGDVLLGVPRLRTTMTSPSDDAVVFVRLLEVAREKVGYRVQVLGGQEGPVRLSAPTGADDARPKDTTAPRGRRKAAEVGIDLPGLAWIVAEGTEIYVEVSSSSNAFAQSTSVWSASGGLQIDLPVLTRP